MSKLCGRYAILVAALLLSLTSCHFLVGAPDPGASGSLPARPKYIFIFLADGGGTAQVEVTRLYNRHIYGQGLTLSDKIMKEGSLGLLTTHSADFLVTDSAAAATALALGCKAKIPMIGMCADGTTPKSVLEVAKDQGMRIGLITTAEVYDASPAAFASHVSNRNSSSAICDQYLDLEPQLLMGGGKDSFLAQGQPGSRRKDDKDLLTLFKNRGYAYVENKKDLTDTQGPKVLGLFSLRDMNFEIDKNKELEPSVYDMTKSALRILQNDLRTGFMLFVENEHVDSAAHFSDLPALLHDFREFDRAVGVAYEFYQKHRNETLLLVTSDHDTGGLNFTTSARGLPNGRFSRAGPSAEDLKKLAGARISLRKAAATLGRNPTAQTVKELVEQFFKGFTLPPEVVQAIVERKFPGPTFSLSPTAAALGAMIAYNTHAYWSTSGHTNQPVFVAALGIGAERFSGYQDNTDFAKHLFALLGENKPQP
ncbi:MAG: alkaline phosphatase [Candidatus Binatia bacterium]